MDINNIKPNPIQKISEYLSDCGSHEIYTAAFIKRDFEMNTGKPLPAFVRTFSIEETIEAMSRRGLGGSLPEVKAGDRVIWGYKMAQDFAKNLVNFTSMFSGRGRIHFDCIRALQEAGQ